MAGIGSGIGLIATIIFGLLIILMPVSLYAAQKWAYKSYREHLETNRLLTIIAQQTGADATRPDTSNGIKIIDS